MELIERYIYAVTKRFSGDKKKEIAEELKTIIFDMLESYDGDGDTNDDNKVKLVLEELGDPEVLAKNYGANRSYLISPKYFEIYVLVLKIVTLSVIGGLSIAIFIGAITKPTNNIGELIGGYFSGLFNGVAQGFAWTTAIFYLIEKYKSRDLDKEKGELWDITKLPALPNKKAIIPAGETIFSIVFSTIFYTVILGSLFLSKSGSSVLTSENTLAILPFFNIDILRSYTFIFIIGFILSIGKDLLKLISRKWTVKLSITASIISIINMILSIFVINDSRLWDVKFPAEVMSKITSQFDFITFWSNLRSWIIVFIIGVTIIDVTVTMIKGFKYGK